MEFRVYDNEEKKWIKENILLSPNGELFSTKQSFFGTSKTLTALDLERYIYHKNIGLTDKNETEVFEGDYIKANVGKTDENSEDKIEIGLVVYAYDLSAYIILCVDSDTFYTLGSNVSSEIEVIGNVFDGYKE